MFNKSDRMRFVSTLLAFLLAFGSPVGIAQDAKGQKRKANQTSDQNNATKN